MMSVNPGLRTENILTMNISLPKVKYPTPQQRLTFFKTLMERLQAASLGVGSAGAVQFLSLRMSILSVRIGVSGFQIQGRPAFGSEPRTEAIAAGGDMRVLKPVFLTVVCALVIAAAAHTQQKQSSDSECIPQGPRPQKPLGREPRSSGCRQTEVCARRAKGRTSLRA